MSKHSSILMALGEAPEGQIDAKASARLRGLALQEQVRSDELLAIIDDCVYGALASDFAISAMNLVWGQMLEDEGLTKDQALAARDPSLRASKIEDQ